MRGRVDRFDIVIVGAGAAGMMAAIVAGRRGRRVLVVEHARNPGEKIRISGGGRCNFTNIYTAPDRFLSNNPRFSISALTRYRPEDFIALVKSHGIGFHEKARGQLFCDGSSVQVVNMLVGELGKAGAELRLATEIEGVERAGAGFVVRLSSGPVAAEALIVASGGKSIPKMGATGFAYKLAEQFGLKLTETRPGLVPLTFEPGALAKLQPLAGISTPVEVRCARQRFEEAMLFTHRGLSGPAILQISSFWREGAALEIDLVPGLDIVAKLGAARRQTPKLALQNVLGALLPRRLGQMLAEEIGLNGMIGDFSDKKINAVAHHLKSWTVKPVSSEGYRTAEVTLGGVDTAGLDARTLGARAMPGLYFVGEAVDVTGWLGGYNFQWAWASGWAAGQVA